MAVEWEWDQHGLADCICEMGDADFSQAEALIYKNSVTDFYSKLNLCQSMTQLLMLGLYYLAQFFTPFPWKSLVFPLPSAPCTSVKAGGEQLGLGPYAPAFTGSIAPLLCTLLPGLLFWVPVEAVPTVLLCFPTHLR